MKKSIRFEQIENTVSEKMAKEGYIKAENMSFGKRLIAAIFFAGSVQALYWFGYFLVGNPTFSGTTNEYQFTLSLKWFVMLFCLYFLFNMIFLGAKYRCRNNIKLAYKSNVWLAQLSVIFYWLLIIDLQLLTKNPYLRIFNILVVSGCFIFSIIKSIKKIKNLIYKNQEADRLSKLMTENPKMIKSILTILFIASVVSNIFSNELSNQTPKPNIEGRIILALVPVIPILFSIFSIYAFPWLSETMARIYFLNEFSEEFRQKFKIEKKLWYGSKSKEHKEEQKKKQHFSKKLSQHNQKEQNELKSHT
ncbi:hypothetical protein A5821_002359 [Enterococcus sp. 7F3_DIV0205]|uniref:Uncharacterized protein n=1 Tax=Candidatus Enterococcus palustris TaxID=1834189 RepID=A0AAQ3WAR5_9ENTE|nr:hypothetical protein [Enterococcus sp. 7F3_DIV0205]OTN82789.1 hypothetical protein A5821_002712 [Enterococcus sp. 7F3_DIV0205]